VKQRYAALFDDARPTLALLVAGVLSTVVLVTLPIFVAAMVAHFQWGAGEVGWLASADMMGSAIASLCAIPFIRRLPWRPAACAAIAVVVAGNLASVHADDLYSLMAARVIAGLGNGLLLSIAYVGLCRSRNPDQYFGLYTFSQLGLQAVLLSLLPSFLSRHGLNMLYEVLAAIAVGTLPLVLLFPRVAPSRCGDPGCTAEVQPRGRRQTNAALGLFAQGAYFLAPAAAWSYLERIGQSFSLTLDSIGQALSIASLTGIAGPLLVVALGVRAPRMTSMTLGTGLSVAAMALLMSGTGFVQFLVAACAFNFAWNFTFPYQMGLLAALDDSDAVPVLSLVVQLVALAVGPAIATFLHPESGYRAILLACVGCYLVSLGIFRMSSPANG